MFPDTLLGLVVFSAAAGPGYLYVRLSRAREPRYERTALEEGAEFVVFGALSSALAILLTLGVGDAIGLLNADALRRDATTYILDEPLRVSLALAVVLALSYGTVWLLTTRLIHRGRPTISPGETAWYAAFHRLLPAEHGAYVTVELRDGRALAGIVVAYTPDTDEPREILLSRPFDGNLWLRGVDGTVSVLPDAFLILQSPDILTISGRYALKADGGEPVLGIA